MPKTSDNIKKGRLGEKIAEDFLICNGYEILQKNYNKSVGEIDIIANKNGTIVFVEVKLRNSLKNGLPRESVGFSKQKKIKETANYYIYENRLVDVDFRFDVIEVFKENTVHIENAFW